MDALGGWDISILTPGLFESAVVEGKMGRVLIAGGFKLLGSLTNGLRLNGSETDAIDRRIYWVAAQELGSRRS